MFRKRIALFLIPALLIATMAYGFTRDWSNTTPVDHSKNNTWPGEDRQTMVDVSDRLPYIYGFTSGETTTGVKKIPFEVQGSDPGAIANQIQCYSKDDGGKAEFYCQDEDGDVIQITKAGVLNESAAASVCTTTYPVGSIFISIVSTNPGTSLGCGTWVAFGAGKMMISLDSGDTDFDTAEETGGAKTVTLTTTELPAHTHTVQLHNWVGQLDGGNPAGTNLNSNAGTEATTSTGSGSAFSIMNPFIAVYMFKRTA